MLPNDGEDDMPNRPVLNSTSKFVKTVFSFIGIILDENRINY